jgi:hypothetical protein
LRRRAANLARAARPEGGHLVALAEAFGGVGEIDGVVFRRLRGSPLKVPLILCSRLGDTLAVVRQFLKLARRTSTNFRLHTAARSAKATWFRLLPVQIGNATAEYPGGDTVHVVEPWSPPDVWPARP